MATERILAQTTQEDGLAQTINSVVLCVDPTTGAGSENLLKIPIKLMPGESLRLVAWRPDEARDSLPNRA